MLKAIKFFGITLLVFGVAFSTWNLYGWWNGMQSVHHVSSAKVPVNHSQKVKIKTTKMIKDHTKKQQQKSNSQSVQPVPIPPKNFSTLHYDFLTGEKVAKLRIPALHSVFSVFWGTTQNVLKKGVGMYVSQWTTVPNSKAGNTVLAGHRDTVFYGLKELKKGEKMFVTFNGKTRKYRIRKIWIVDASNRNVITKKKKPTLTLTTCYPFHYIGDAPKRYIVQSTLIS